MKKSIPGVDTIELSKRFKQHKADMAHLVASTYLPTQEKCFQLRSKKLRFHKSLRKEEENFIQYLTCLDLGETPESLGVNYE